MESEASLFFEGILDGLNKVSPREVVAVERVVDCMIWCNSKGNAVGRFKGLDGNKRKRSKQSLDKG